MPRPISLRRGDAWREALLMQSVAGAVVASHGSGPPPRVIAREPVAASAWSAQGTTNVWQASWTWAALPQTSSRPYLWKIVGGTVADTLGAAVLLNRRTSLGALTAEGDFFVSWSSGSLAATLYIYTATDPRTLADGTYQAPKRDFAVRLGAGGQATRIVTEGQMHPDGSLIVGGDLVSRVACVDGGKHNHFQSFGALRDSVLWHCAGEAAAGSSTLGVFYADNASTLSARYEDCLAVGGPRAGSCVAYYAHSVDAPRGHQLVEFLGSYAVDCANAWSTVTNGNVHVGRSPSGRWAFARSVDNPSIPTVGGSAVADGILVYNPVTGRALQRMTLNNAGGMTARNIGLVTLFPVQTGAISVEGAGAVVLERSVILARAASGFPRAAIARNGTNAVTLNGVVVETTTNTSSLNGGGAVTGSNCIFIVQTNGNLGMVVNGTTHTTLSALQAATGSFANSVFVTRAQLATLFLGNPEDGDFRLNPSAPVTGPDGTVYNGTLPNGTPITSACGLEDPPSAWPSIPATLAEAVEEYLV